MDEKTQRVSLRAYELWENEGRPHGRDAEHWVEAERQIAAEMRDPPIAAEVEIVEVETVTPAAVSPAPAPAGARPAEGKPARSGKNRR